MLTTKELMSHAEHDYFATLAAECQDDTFSSMIDPEKAAKFPSSAEWLLKSGHTEEEIWDNIPDVAMEAGFDEPDWL